MKTIKCILFLGVLMLLSTNLFSQGTERRKLSSFTKIETGESFDVTLEKGNEESVKIVAEGISPEKIITEVAEGTLKIYLKKGIYRNIKTKIFVTYKNLEKIVSSGSGNVFCLSDIAASSFKIHSSGSGNIIVEGKIKTEHAELEINGSGNVKLMSLETGDFQISVNGSGDLTITSGHTTTQSIHVSGSGDFDSFGMKSETCSLEVSGSGNAAVNVNKTLNASISGSGNINYTGDAQINKIALNGSGRINKK